MIDLLTTESVENEENFDMGSWNHALVQSRLNRLLPDDKFTLVTELSLDISTIDLSQFNLKARGELKPDICLYPPTRRGLSRPTDILKMSEMPLLAIEILSPTQGMYEIKEKFKVYFALGIKSCWLVAPEIGVITVYSSLNQFKNFDLLSENHEVIDEVLDIQLSLEKIFD
ncbi:MAG: Uma2 family endonuclease [Thioploca sp.]|nr:Uma2 family endonuclease [Thioploca sp.]